MFAIIYRPIARIKFGEVQHPQNVDLFDPISGLFEPHPLNPPSNGPPFFTQFVNKNDPLARFGVFHGTPCTPALAMDLIFEL